MTYVATLSISFFIGIIGKAKAVLLPVNLKSCFRPEPVTSMSRIDMLLLPTVTSLDKPRSGSETRKDDVKCS